jgi:hypothetical protein
VSDPAPKSAAAPAVGALASLAAALSCCLPLGPVVAAAGAAGASAFLVHARPYLMGLSLALLAFGFWRAYARKACTPHPAIWPRLLLWLALAANAGFLFFPQPMANLLAGSRAPAASPSPLTPLTPAAFQELRQDFNAASDRTRLLVLLSPT